MKGIFLTFWILAGLSVIALFVVLLRAIVETIADIFNNFIGWIGSFIPSWIKGK